jgi:hypothetical protein
LSITIAKEAAISIATTDEKEKREKVKKEKVKKEATEKAKKRKRK